MKSETWSKSGLRPKVAYLSGLSQQTSFEISFRVKCQIADIWRMGSILNKKESGGKKAKFCLPSKRAG